MRLNPKEQEKLMLHMAGNLAAEGSVKTTFFFYCKSYVLP